jgi:REP element-mobilizing transposase RayT
VNWLFEARKRYGIEILNYSVTSNHIHLLVYGNEDQEVIPRSLQLVAGRTAQAYNRRKNRKGAFWEDRYHATAVDTDEHLIRCLVYIDMNMVRAGVVNHPREWRHSGYHEIMNPPRRYQVLARIRLMQLLDLNERQLIESYPHWFDDFVQEKSTREKAWTEPLAVGSYQFVETVQKQLGVRAKYRSIKENSSGTASILQEPIAAYNSYFGHEIIDLSAENRLPWLCFHKI